jgi:subfamily B ATP-binding cassette protein MsbA
MKQKLTRSISILRHRLQVLRQIYGMVSDYKWLIVALMVLSFIVSITNLVGLGTAILLISEPTSKALSEVLFLKSLIVEIGGLELVERIYVAAAVLVLAAIIRGVLVYITGLLSQWLSLRITRELRLQVFNQLLEIEMRFIYRESIGNLYTILASYTSRIWGLVTLLMSALRNVLNTVLSISVLVVISWELTFLAFFLLIGLSTPVRNTLSRRMQAWAERVRHASIAHNNASIESLSAMKLIRVFAKESETQAQYQEILDRLQNLLFRSGVVSGLTGPSLGIVNALALGFLLVGSTWFFPTDPPETWLGLLVPFFLLVYRLIGPISSFSSMRISISTMIPDLRALIYFLNREDKPFLENGDIRFEVLNDNIRFENVQFAYDLEGEEEVIQGVSFTIPKSQMTAIVGPSGAGKTTLVDLIVRLYDPQHGRIVVDDVDLRDFDIHSWRSKLAVVSQDIFLFDDTVRANLLFARGDASEEELICATKQANAHDFIMELPEGYETKLGKGGVRLSGGQRQRIAIARALLVDPEVLILDEATSNLDTKSERIIQEAIDTVTRERTVVAIAHRLSTIRNAKNIVVLDRGKVVEEGTHRELMMLEGYYAEMVQVQSLEREPELESDSVAQ